MRRTTRITSSTNYTIHMSSCIPTASIVVAPFAFGGNPSTASGPRAIESLLRQDSRFSQVNIRTIDQQLTESPIEYLYRLEALIEKTLASHKRCCILGGNHLTSYPAHNHFAKLNPPGMSVVLDAHCDNYPSSSLLHSSFLSFLVSSKYQLGLIGARDGQGKSAQSQGIDSLTIDNLLQRVYKDNQIVNLVDIDVDVLDDSEFSSYCDFIPNGLTLQDINVVIDAALYASCPLLCITEYSPLFDSGMKDAAKIVDWINHFLNNTEVCNAASEFYCTSNKDLG